MTPGNELDSIKPLRWVSPAEGRFDLEGDGAARVFDEIKIEGIDKMSNASCDEDKSGSEAAEGKRDETFRRFVVLRTQIEKYSPSCLNV